MADILDLLSADDQSFPDQARAYADALRRREAGALALTALTGNRQQVGNLGNETIQADQRVSQQMQQPAEFRLGQALRKQQLQVQQQRYEQQQRHQQALEDLAAQRLGQPNIGVNPVTGAEYNKKGGRAPAGAPAGAPPAPVVPADPNALEPWDKRLPKLEEGLKKDLDASGSSRSPFGANQAIINKAQGLSVLMHSGQDLTPEQMDELSTGVAALVSGGTSAAQSTIEHITPPGVSKSAARLKEWLTSQPHGAGQQAFVDMFQHLVDRESQSAGTRILKTQLQRVGAHSDYATLAPNRMKQLFRSYGLDPTLVDQIKGGTYSPPKDEAPAAASGTRRKWNPATGALE